MVNIRFSDLKIEVVRQSSGIFSGKNTQIGWKAVSKQNQGLGQITGQKNKMSDHIHTVYNPDSHKSD